MKSKFNKNIATVASLTATSRVLGFIRDVVIAWLLGAGPIADAFFVAFRIPNMLRRLVAEGATNVAFVPVFNETLEKEGLKRALSMARSVITLMLLVLGIIVVIGEFIAPLIVGIIAPGFLNTPTFDVALHLTRIMFPYILLVSIVALFAGMLNSLGHFAAPAAAPVILNLFMIASPVIFYKHIPFFKSPADAIAWGVITGGLFQIVLQIHPLKRLKVSIKLSLQFEDPRIIQIAKLMGIAALAASVYQINVLIGTLLASFLPRGSVSFLYYANRLIELPLGIFAFAVGNVMLPAMSQASAKMNMSEMSSLTGRSINAILLFTIPASIGIFVLAEPLITLLFVRGNFSFQHALSTAQALRMYAIGLWAIGASRILIQAFYAMQQARTAVRVAWATLGLNIVFCLILMPSMEHSGIALASSISVIIQLVILLFLLSKKGVVISRMYYLHFTKMAASGVLMVLCIHPLLYTRFWTDGLSTYSILMLGTSVGIGAASYFTFLWIMGIRRIRY
ncbi:MAG: murein biosynthesis integral membrane protein MurJ [Deltaproteobacteria bacterium]|nr:murein biosynthesis integral membrane protein MurJ [Deltaproteobacteria bacterium]